jgi:hypothetical protein
MLFGCAPERKPSDAELRRRFEQSRDSFAWLRDAIRGESLCEVRTDAITWTEPCDAWPHGCGRWVDGRPDPVELARVGRMPIERAREYLRRLDSAHAKIVQRMNDGSVEITMFTAGIVPSGLSKSIVWSAQAPAPLVEDTDRIASSKGRQAARIEGDWYIVVEWN